MIPADDIDHTLLAELARSPLARRGLSDEAIDAAVRAAVRDGRSVADPARPPPDRPWLFSAPEARRVLLLGDLHGRWDRARPAIEHAGWLHEGRLRAGPGDVIVQLGDLIDADLGGRAPPGEDARGDALIERHRAAIDAATMALPGAERGRWKALAEGRGADARARRHRYAMVGALLAMETLRGVFDLMDAARRSGARATCLLGNHELDLLSGRLAWFAEQKRWVLALAGISPVEPFVRDLRRAADRTAVERLLADTPVLRRLLDMPFAARVGPILALHGGPTRRTTAALRAEGVDDGPRFAEWLGRRHAAGFADPFFAEGASIFAPDPAADTFVHDVAGLATWLRASGAGLLAVGHSPFIGFRPGRWLDLSDPAVRARARRVERLGPLGVVLKLDTNLKRDDVAIACVFDRGTDTLTPPGGPLQATERRRALLALEPLLAEVDGRRGPVPGDLVEPGVDGAAWSRLMEAIESVPDDADRGRIERGVGPLLRAGPLDMEPLIDLVRGAASGSAAGLETHHEAVVALVERLAAEALAGSDETPTLFVDPMAHRFDGVRYRLVDAVADRVRRRVAHGVRVVELVRHRGRPALRRRVIESDGRVLEAPMEALPDGMSWAALCDTARAAQGGPWTGVVLSGAESGTTVRVAPASASPTLPMLPASLVEVLLGDAVAAARGDVGPAVLARLPDGRRQRALLTRRRWLLQTDTVFVHPAHSTTAVRLDPHGRILTRMPHGEALLTHLPERLTLFTRLKTAVARHLEAGEPERIGTGSADPRRGLPGGQGAWLFTAPNRTAVETYTPLNPVPMTFAVSRAILADLAADGLVAINAFTPEGDPIGAPDPDLGVRGAAIEVVGLGRDGVMAMYAFRV